VQEMKNLVDLTNLREITEGDTTLEQELFTDFMGSFESLLVSANHKNIAAGWSNDVHAMKGLAMNLGAKQLADICHEAQQNDDGAQNAAFMQRIKDDYFAVKEYLITINN
jgi:HPt (histidine-containing phosphotransfer) domain-containing protein